MTIYRLAQTIEIKFWNVIIPVMEEEGPLMEIINFMKHVFRTKQSQIAFLVLVWSAIGFITGMIIGRVLWILQLI